MYICCDPACRSLTTHVSLMFGCKLVLQSGASLPRPAPAILIKFPPRASSSLIETSNTASMKKMLHSLATLLCLLTLLFSGITSVQAQHQTQPLCSHCPKHAPARHTIPACCSTHQPSAAVASVEVRPPVPPPVACHLPPSLRPVVYLLNSHALQQLRPPLRVSPTPLRI